MEFREGSESESGGDIEQDEIRSESHALPEAEFRIRVKGMRFEAAGFKNAAEAAQ
jgi:hypothetical protein